MRAAGDGQRRASDTGNVESMARAYSSPRRAAEAASTRAAIIAAASTLFVRDGYAATSLRAIAQEAHVSVPTVQLQGSKHSLLIAAFEVAFAGDEGAQSLVERSDVAAIMAEPDFDTAIERYVAFLDGANQRAAGSESTRTACPMPRTFSATSREPTPTCTSPWRAAGPERSGRRGPDGSSAGSSCSPTTR
jgi:AcrR family transcriptional regulator